VVEIGIVVPDPEGIGVVNVVVVVIVVVVGHEIVINSQQINPPGHPVVPYDVLSKQSGDIRSSTHSSQQL